MEHFLSALLKELRENPEPPCISIYMPTHRTHPECLQDPIRFKNLLSKAQEELVGEYDNKLVTEIIHKFDSQKTDSWFWTHQADGLAMFVSPNVSKLVKLHHPVDEMCSVADSFHIKPLLRILQVVDRYQVLCLSQHRITLYEGSSSGLQEVKLHEEVPRNLADTLVEQSTEAHLTVASYNGANGPNMHHGHGEKSDAEDKDLKNFFLSLDQAISKYHSNQSALPLIIVGVAEDTALFKAVSRNIHVLEQGIAKYPDSIDHSSLEVLSWKIMEKFYEQKMSEALNVFHGAEATDKASTDIDKIAEGGCLWTSWHAAC
jgi:hypothetical protein